MDHPLYLAWALMPQPVFAIEARWRRRVSRICETVSSVRSMPRFGSKSATRDGTFPIGDPDTTTLDFINGLTRAA